MAQKSHIAIIGAGNIGASIANGLVTSDHYLPENIILTRRRTYLLENMKQKGFVVTADNKEAVRKSEIVIIAVEPQQIDGVLNEIRSEFLVEAHVLISVVTGVSIKQIIQQIGKKVAVIRAMPNTAIAVRESITCLASNGLGSENGEIVESIFSTVGKTLWINEEEMVAATALGACGIAFFMRAIRAASQGGIEIGFDSKLALAIAAQTAKGAASLLLSTGNHPEEEIDKVTTPRGSTISGLNQMENEGFSSALIKGIKVSAEKAAKLYSKD